MFGSKRGWFSAERGSTTSWLAGVTSVALLIGTAALPAVATEDLGSLEEPQLQSEEILSEVPMEDQDPTPVESVFTMPTSGKGITPKVIAGNPTCSSIRPDLIELKIEPPETGEYTDGYATIQFTRVDKEVRWSSNVGMDVVVVKGGDAGNAYVYDPPGPEQKSDTGLYSPIKNGQPAGVSHVSFCYDKPIQLEKPTLNKTAKGSFDREYTWKIAKTVDSKEKSTQEIADGKSASFGYQVVAEQTGVNDSNWKVSGKITINNPNDVAIPVTGLKDSLDIGGKCTLTTPESLPKGDTVVDYTCSFPDNAPTSYSGTNTATVTFPEEFEGYGKEYAVPDGTASGTKDFTLVQDTTKDKNKTVSVSDTLADPALSPATLSATDDKPYTKEVYDYRMTFEGEPGVCTKYPNTAAIVGDDKKTLDTATATAEVCVGLDLKVSKDATGTYGRTYEWDLDKSVDKTRIDVAGEGEATFNYTVKATPTGISDAGWKVTGKITVSNPNEWLDITADVSDAINNGGVCLVEGKAVYEVPVSKGQSKQLSYECSYASVPTKTTVVTNTATATWAESYPTPSSSDIGTKTFDFDPPAETNKTITVFDDKTDPSKSVLLGEATWGATATTFTYSVTHTGTPGQCVDYTNTAWIDELGKEDETADSETVTVCAGADLSVEKDAAGSYTRTYTWDITKVADPTTQNAAIGEKATFDYTVVVNQTGIADSKVALGGTITITNPNTWDVKLDSIIDNAGAGWVCTVTSEGPYIVPAGVLKDGSVKPGTLPLAYACTARGADTGTNTVSITWGKEDPYTYPTGTDSDDAGFTLARTEVDKIVRVTDLLVETELYPNGVLDEELTAADGAPFTSKTYTYSLDWPAEGTTCVPYDNTALVHTGTDEETGAPTGVLDSATETVEVCGLSNIEVIKTDADNGKPLAGAVFQLWVDVNKNGAYNEGDTLIEGSQRTTGDDGKARWENLLPGYYLVQELTPPPGYALSNPAIRPVVIGLEQPTDVEVLGRSALVAQVDDKSTGSGPAVVSGHEEFSFQANQVAYWCPDGGTKIEGGFGEGGYAYTLDAAYSRVIVKSGAGMYAHTIFNTPSAGQFVWADTNGSFSFDPAGATGDKQISHVILCYLPEVPEDGEVSLIFANTRLPGDVEVIKTDATNQAPLEGAGFQLWTDVDKDGMFTANVDTVLPGTLKSTGANGKASWLDLAWGYYLVQEVTPPTGYALSSPAFIQAFEINAELDGGTIILAFANARLPGQIQVVKADDAKAPLAGVTFELFADANNNNTIDAGETLGQKVTGADGKTAVWGGLAWRSDYKVLEVSWPTGYTLSGTAVTGPYTISATQLLVTVERVNNRIDIPKLDKTSTPASEGAVVPIVERGSVITYAITVKNEGALPVTGRTLVDTLPTGVTLVAGSLNPSIGADTAVAGKITWTFDLGAFSSKVFTYQVRVDSTLADGSRLINTATYAGLSDTTTHEVFGPEAVVEEIEEEVVAVEDDVAIAAEEELADTGAGNVGSLVTAALLTMLAGGLMVTFGRRRREQ